MPLRDLLVHLDPSRHCEARVKAAVALAARCEAHLTGLYVSPRLELPPFLSDQFAPAQFEAATGAANCEAEWIELTGAAGALVPAQVRHVDMAILGQIDPAEKLQGTD